MRNLSANLNQFLNNIKLKKQYLNNLKANILLLNNLKNVKSNILNSGVFSKNKYVKKNSLLVTYVINILFSRTNTLLHITNSSGKLLFFYSAGLFKIKGRKKRARVLVFKSFYKILMSKLAFVKKKPIALHFKNVGSNKFWIIKRLKKKLFIKAIRSFDVYPYNGCRKPKIRIKN
jgi:ribosomal protein S11